MQKFKGLGVAVVTPFDAQKEIDYPALGRIINHLIDGGVDYLVIHGSTGEAATLNSEEKRKSLDYIIEIVNGRLPIVLGIGSNDTKSSMRVISNFDFSGVDGLLIASPSYNKPSQEGIFQHFKSVAEMTDLPIILYNVPGRTASNMNAETTLRLAHKIDQVVAIKEASGNLQQVLDILKDKPKDFILLSGDDPLTMAMAAYGAEGLISVAGNAYPKAIKELTHAAVDGDFNTARTIQFAINNITKMMFEEGNPAGIKEILYQMNLCKPFVRLPLTEVSASLSSKIINERSVFESIINGLNLQT